MSRSRWPLVACLCALAACSPDEPAPPPHAQATSSPAPPLVEAEPPVDAPAGEDASAGEAPEPRAPPGVSRVEDPSDPRPGDLVRVREFHENGRMATERTERVEEGGARIRTGAMKAWHDNGQVYVEGGYDEQGRKTGRWRYWRPDGRLVLEGDYLDNLREGVWVESYPNGQKRSEGLYHVGLLEGPWRYWHENGQQLAEGEYVNSLRQGVWLFWNADGTVDEARAGTYRDHARLE
jgi:antitoxin component YwqK of YwqJK toxin-antitoxin module